MHSMTWERDPQTSEYRAYIPVPFLSATISHPHPKLWQLQMQDMDPTHPQILDLKLLLESYEACTDVAELLASHVQEMLPILEASK